jgi:hypothetical protein
MNNQNLKKGDLCLIISCDRNKEINNMGRVVTLEKFVPAGAPHMEFNGARYMTISEDGWIVSADDLWAWTMRKGYHKCTQAGVYAHRLRKIGDQDGFNIKSTEQEKEHA